MPFRFLIRQLRARALAVFGAFLLLGMLLAGSFAVSLWGSACLAALTLLALPFIRKRECAVLLLLGVVLPLSLGAARYDLEELRKPLVEAAYSARIEGDVVTEVAENGNGRLIAGFHVTKIEGEASDETVRLYLRSDELPLEGIEYGQHLAFTGHIWPQEHATNPYQMDQVNWLKGLGYQGMAAAKLEDVEVVSARWGWRTPFLSVKRAVARRIDALFPRSRGLARAFILGDRTLLESDTRSAFNATGVAHLISLSGMHVAVLALLLQKLFSVYFRRQIADGIALVFIGLYAALIGFPPALVRAALMFAIASGAGLCGRPSDGITRLSAALILMLLVNPFYIYSVSFLLSFAASAGIILFKEPMDKLLRKDLIPPVTVHLSMPKRLFRRGLRYIVDLIGTTLAATLTTLPLVIQWFGGQSALSIPVNLITVPIAMAAYPLSLLATCLSFLLPHVMTIAAWVPDTLYQILAHVIRGAASLGIGMIRTPNYPAWLCALHIALFLMASCLCRFKGSVRRVLAPCLAGLIFLSMGAAWVNSLGFTMVFLDAGQADATVLKVDGHVYVYDTGEPYTPIDDYISGACLGVDAVFLSHPHYDHAGGLTSLLSVTEPRVIYVPAGWDAVEAVEDVENGIRLAKAMNIPIVELHVGDTVALSDRATATVYGPEGMPSDENDMSLLLEIRRGDASLLLTGDLTTKGTPSALPNVDILRVAHHGSPKSTDEAFLVATTPEIAVISVGDNNYGHPSEEVLERLASVGAQVYRTDQSGAITVRAGRDGYTVNTYLSQEASLESR